MGFLDVVSAAVPGAVAYQGGKRQAEQEGQDREEGRFLKLLALTRQQQQDALDEQVRRAQLQRLQTPEPETFGDLEPVMDASGKPRMVQRGNRGTLRESSYAPVQKPEAERNIDPNSPAGIAAAAAKARAAAKAAAEFGVVPTIGAGGEQVYTRRAQAPGERVPQGGGNRTGQGSIIQRTQALGNVRDALDRFENTLATTGSTITPGVEKSTLQTDYENLQLQLKELYNLGVLNGPDLMLMRRIVNDPASLTGRALALGSAEEQTARTQAQVAKMREVLGGFEKRLAEIKPGGVPAAKGNKPPWAEDIPDEEWNAYLASKQATQRRP